MTRYFCDLCDAPIKNDNKTLQITWHSSELQDDSYALCEECVTKFNEMRTKWICKRIKKSSGEAS